MKFGFIGIGNMGGAILKGLVIKKMPLENIFVYDINEKILDHLKNDHNINVCNNYEELINSVDCVILAVKPDIFKSLLNDISHLLEKNRTLIVSIAAGLKISSLENIISYENPPIIRIMPNLNAGICMSTTAYCYNKNVNENQIESVVNAFNTIGSVYKIEEEKFNIFTAIASCSPAYVYLFIDSIAKGAQKMGLNKADSIKIATDTVIGSANMLSKSKKHPWELIDNVCSPGGTTIEGICTLEDENFQQTIVKAIENSINKDNILNKKYKD